MPFDSGLAGGVVFGVRMSRSASHTVARAVYGPPLSLSHWTVGWAQPRGKRAATAAHELLNIRARQIPWGGHPTEDLAIMTVEREGQLDILAIPTRDLQGIAAPALVGVPPGRSGRGGSGCCVAAPPPAVRAEHPHHPPHALAIVAGGVGGVDEGRHPLVTIRAPSPQDRPNLLFDQGIVGLGVVGPRGAPWR